MESYCLVLPQFLWLVHGSRDYLISGVSFYFGLGVSQALLRDFQAASCVMVDKNALRNLVKLNLFGAC